MKIKSFIAHTVHEALSDIKREMGDSPLILETRCIDEGDIKGISGKKLVEIVVAENFNEKTIKEDQKRDNGLNVNLPASLHSGGEMDYAEINPLLKQLNLSLDDSRSKAVGGLYHKLRSQQIEKEHAQVLIRETLNELGKDGLVKVDLQRRKIKEKIINKIKIADSSSGNGRMHNIMAFIGASGVGKTTAISKLASNARIYSDKDILLISVKGDSVEKLEKLAEVIGAAVEVVTTSQELRMIIDKHEKTSFIFIDTPGINYFNNVMLLELREYIQNMPNLETHLVVSATTRYVDIINALNNLSIMPVHRLLFTKTDETSAYGTLFSVAMATEIPLSYITDGQKVPGGIEPVTADAITKMISI